MNQKINKSPLDLNLYIKYGIAQEYSAFEISIFGVGQEECDDLEAEYLGQGYKVFHSEMIRKQGEIFDFKLITAKMSYTF